MTAGAVIPPTVMPLRLPIPGKPKHVVDTHTPIELRSETPHTEIFYTVDGSKPNPFPWVGCDWRTRRYHHPIFLDEGRKVVKALAVDTTKNRESFVVTKTFFVTRAPKTESTDNLSKLDGNELNTENNKVKDVSDGEQDAVISDVEEPMLEDEKLLGLPCETNDYEENSFNVNTEYDVETAVENEIEEEKRDDDDDLEEEAFNDGDVVLAEDAENHNEALFDIEEVNNLENIIGEVIAEKITEVTFGGRFEIQYNSEVESRCQNCQVVMHPNPLCQFCTDCGESVEQESEYALPSCNQMGKCPDCRSFVPTNMSCCIACEFPFEMTRAAVTVKERKTCRSCYTVNTIDAETCAMCGKSLSVLGQNSRPHLPKPSLKLHNQCTVITTREFSKCEECGRTNSREARFCDWCGQKLLSSLELNVECRQCRTENQCQARYCQECGCPLHPPNNEAILAKLQKQYAEKAVMAFCQTKDQFSQTLDLWKNPDVQSQGVQTSGYYSSGPRGKRNVNKMRNTEVADIRVMTPRAVSPGRGFWRQQVEHITRHLKVHAYNDAQFRSNLGLLKLKDLKDTCVEKKDNDLNIVLTFTLGRQEDCSSVIPSIGGRRVCHIAPALIQDTANTANTVEHVPLNSQTAPKQQPRKKSARKKQETSEDVLLSAIQKLEDVNVIKAILSKGVNLARCTKNGCSALTLAVQCGHFDAIPLLMQYGAGNFKFPEAQPPLHAAVLLQEAGQPAVETLLRFSKTFLVTMTTKKVLANIYYFATEILQTAHFKTNWNETSIRRALQWAAYCVKVCDKCDGCSNKELHLNDMLEEVFCASADWTGQIITVEILKNSMNILCQSLLQNPSMTEGDRMCIIKSYVDSGKSQELIKVCAELAMMKAGLTLTLETLNQHSLVDYGLTDYHLAGGWLKEALPSQPAGSDELLWQRLELFGSSHLVLLLELLVDKSESLLSKELQQSILQWLLHQTRCTVWQVPPIVLSRVAAAHVPFYKAYINFLVTEVEKLQPCYTKSGYHWITRLDCPSTLKYTDIVTHFQELCRRSEMLGELTNCIVTEHAMKSKSSVWLDIQSDLGTNWLRK